MRNNISVKKQDGIALVMAIMIVALVVTIAVEMSWRFDLSIARTSNRWQSVQAENYIDGVESLAKFALKEDLDSDKEDEDIFDDLTEPWADGLPPVPTDHGMIMGKIEDAQGRFNLNLLEGNSWKGTGVPHEDYSEHQRRFIRFLQTLNISEEEDPEESPLYLSEYEAIGIMQAIMDWMDSDEEFDSVTGYGGAEADEYLQFDPPITIANRSFISVSELRVIRGVTPILYEKILPFVVVLNPVEGSAGSSDAGGEDGGAASEDVIGLNVNTMPLELVRSLNDIEILQPLSLDAGERVYNDTRGGLKTIEDFFSTGSVSSQWPDRYNGKQGDPFESPKTARHFDPVGLQFTSDFFIVSAITEVGNEVYRGKSLIYRDRNTGEAETLRKTSTNF